MKVDTVIKYVGLLALLILVGYTTHQCFPKKEVELKYIPTIITQVDTIHDTLKIRTPARVITDTVNLTVTRVIYDTVEPRPRLWPVLSVDARLRDTLKLTTFSLQSGHGAQSVLFAPGPLKSVWADTNPTPRVDFGVWDICKTSTKEKLKYLSLGGGFIILARAVFN